MRARSSRRQKHPRIDRVHSPAGTTRAGHSRRARASSHMASSWPCVRAPFPKTAHTASFAGQQETYLNVRGGDAVLQRVQRVLGIVLLAARAVLSRAESGTGRHAHGGGRAGDGAGRQERRDVHGRSRSQPARLHGHRRRAGLGEAIVSGEVTPDHYVVSRDDGAIVDVFIPDEERGRVLSDGELNRAARARLAARSLLRISAGRRMVHPRRRACCCCRAGPSRRSTLMADPGRESPLIQLGRRGSSTTIPTTARTC